MCNYISYCSSAVVKGLAYRADPLSGGLAEDWPETMWEDPLQAPPPTLGAWRYSGGLRVGMNVELKSVSRATGVLQLGRARPLRLRFARLVDVGIFGRRATRLQTQWPAGCLGESGMRSRRFILPSCPPSSARYAGANKVAGTSSWLIAQPCSP